MTSTTGALSDRLELAERGAVSTPVLVVENLHRTVSYHKILRGVAFTLARGQALAVVGPNGAGKTTLLRVLTGLARATRGRVDLNGSQALVGHDAMVYDALSARENLEFFGKLHGLCDRHSIERLLQTVGLADRQHDRVGTYSRGMKQRVSIARALLAEPDVLYLDEPLSGLDERSCSSVIEILTGIRDSGRAIVFVSHNFSAVAALATRIGYLVAGRMKAIDDVTSPTPDAVSQRYREVVENV